MDNQQEIFPVVDEQGRVVGSATRGECHGGSKLLHPVNREITNVMPLCYPLFRYYTLCEYAVLLLLL